MLKGLRQVVVGLGFAVRLTGFPDVEGIETIPAGGLRLASGLTGFPDVEGIETVGRALGPGIPAV